MRPQWSNRLDPMTIWLVESWLLLEDNKMLIERYTRRGSPNTRKPSRWWVRSVGSAFAHWLSWKLPAGTRSAVAKW